MRLSCEIQYYSWIPSLPEKKTVSPSSMKLPNVLAKSLFICRPLMRNLWYTFGDHFLTCTNSLTQKVHSRTVSNWFHASLVERDLNGTMALRSCKGMKLWCEVKEIIIICWRDFREIFYSQISSAKVCPCGEGSSLMFSIRYITVYSRCNSICESELCFLSPIYGLNCSKSRRISLRESFDQQLQYIYIYIYIYSPEDWIFRVLSAIVRIGILS